MNLLMVGVFQRAVRERIRDGALPGALAVTAHPPCLGNSQPTTLRHHLYGPIITFQRMVGATGFEPATSWSQTMRSTKLSYAPNNTSLPYAQARVKYPMPLVP